MAAEASNGATHSPQVIGNAFVQRYYYILDAAPELLYQFYKDSSTLSWPDANGKMSSVATLQGINAKILSLNFKEYKAEIKTTDAHKSHMGGITVLVTGSLTDKDNLTKNFAQSFFLAPQEEGYFVLNDVFKYVDDYKPVDNEPSRVADPSAPEEPSAESAIDCAESDDPISSINGTIAKPLRWRSWIRRMPISWGFRMLLHGKQEKEIIKE